MIRIGNQTIPTNILLAPLSGWTNLGFRLLARECGARFAFYEMVNAKALLHNTAETISILKTHASDQPIAAQLLGTDPIQMLDAARTLLSRVSVSFIDINSACPVKKIIKKKAGAHLLKEPTILYAIIKKLASQLSVPITVKLRIGFDTYDEHAFITLVRACEDAGAAALFVHGRTRKQAYTGGVHYHAIRVAQSQVAIPVLGSGNIFSVHLAEKMLRETDCAGILVARGAFGNPWIFRDIECYLKTGQLPRPRSLVQKRKMLKKHLAYLAQYGDYSPLGKIGVMRKIAQLYLTDFCRARRIRDRVTSVKDYDELLQLVDSLAL